MDFLQQHIIGLIVTILSIVVAKYAKKFMDLLEERLAIDIDDKAEKLILHMVRKAIRIVYQTFVKQKKIANEWDFDAKKEASIKAYDLVSKEAKRCGLDAFWLKKDTLNDIESELVKVKNDGRKSDV